METKSNEFHQLAGDLPSSVFRNFAYQSVDWIVRYLEEMDDYPVLSLTKPGEIKARLPKAPPIQAEQLERILNDFHEILIPGITHWNHPRFFGYFSITGSYPGIIGELLASALNVNAMLWKTSPAATELEEVVLDWLRQMVGLPEHFDAVINDTASVGSLCAMAAAREFAKLNIREKGLAGRPELPLLRMYTSDQAHSSIEKAAIVLGIGQENIIKIRSDDQYRMDITALREAIQSDLAHGRKPICVIATIGTTSTTSVDPIESIASICEQFGLWLHVDAAYGGSAAVLPEKRFLFNGWEKADSIIINPHKWLFTPIDCSVLFCRRPEILKKAFSLTPEYLRTPEAGEVKNYMEYSVALGRRFRALKLWLVIRSFGIEKIQSILRQHIAFAQQLATMMQQNDQVELLAPVPFSTVVFRFVPDTHFDDDQLNRFNEQLLERVNRTGSVFLSHTKLRDRFALRLAIGNIKTTWEDVQLAWDILQQQAKQLIG
ncbi:MAG: pyridoxal-dependent decarboxylase [candidate division KSB1 bacterium]|nr:pyridoxal-dependent decarboxylase [candidate division KSB1 bacterium]MDZ7336807.1 pyridoxal-dependent decarboxylase [candidate division KSB1 bacterium]MDZ7356645.1 pyridoxal-dependent decarboxylase [candidate division KSB1 bacterium]MDZ7398522.1 pyridoxal-dependent decarboxylase [candidate division KSB1 bacterium]